MVCELPFSKRKNAADRRLSRRPWPDRGHPLRRPRTPVCEYWPTCHETRSASCVEATKKVSLSHAPWVATVSTAGPPSGTGVVFLSPLATEKRSSAPNTSMCTSLGHETGESITLSLTRASGHSPGRRRLGRHSSRPSNRPNRSGSTDRSRSHPRSPIHLLCCQPATSQRVRGGRLRGRGCWPLPPRPGLPNKRLRP